MKKTRETNTYYVLFDRQKSRWFIRHCNRDGCCQTIGVHEGGYETEAQAHERMERYNPEAKFVTGTPGY